MLGPSDSTCARLVLFIGPTLHPDTALVRLLARAGMRALWLAGLEQAARTARLLVLDATVLDATLCELPDAPMLAQLRSQLRCPLLLLAPQADEVDEIVALEAGADAYLALPVAPRRLRAHLHALIRLRRTAPQPGAALNTSDSHTHFEGWVLNRDSAVLSGDGLRVELTHVQARLLASLMQAGGLPLSRTALLAALPRCEGLASRSVDVYVSRLRQRLALEGVQLQLNMVRGCGYALRGALEPVGGGTPPDRLAA
jgi:DNA-binding response OmpR family regulator